ncbi:DUF4190 domain-containing protein [Agilicoccus flavus]|uniref:DUF4190 domain-containing protein n=1 Tax=Agilicoccus flavus TaxID=2775968 RepID=UPI001CF61941|nr:DUF4190 domain-containing protein [Agilicoccus flavus]
MSDNGRYDHPDRGDGGSTPPPYDATSEMPRYEAGRGGADTPRPDEQGPRSSEAPRYGAYAEPGRCGSDAGGSPQPAYGKYDESGRGGRPQDAPAQGGYGQGGYGESGYGQSGYGQGGYDQGAYGPGGPGAGYGEGGYGDPRGAGDPWAPRPSAALAITALVLGVLGFLGSWLVLGAILGLVAVIVGIVAVVKARKGRARGTGMAIGGIVLGVLSMIIAGALVAMIGTFFMQPGFQQCLQEASQGASQTEVQRCLDDLAQQEGVSAPADEQEA